MGQKVHPKIFRIGITQNWKSRWFAKFAKKDFAKNLEQDVKIRKFLQGKLREAGLANIEIERTGTSVTVNIYTSKPGIVIGRRGTGAEELKKELEKKIISRKLSLKIDIHEVAKPYLNAQLVCQNIIDQLEKRIPFRRTAKQAVDQVMRAGAKGARVIVSGRLDGVEIARRETFTMGSLPLHTLRADVDYARGAAQTIYGSVGVKVWIYKGEVFDQSSKKTKR